MRLSALLFSILFGLTLLGRAQGPPRGYDGPIPMAGGRTPYFWDVVPPPAPPRKIDVAQLKSQADELAKLAAGVPPDIEQLKKGLLSKNLERNLKRIEKLSKRLRQELNP